MSGVSIGPGQTQWARMPSCAWSIAFLASDDATYITGAALVSDGGVTASTGQPNFSHFLGDV